MHEMLDGVLEDPLPDLEQGITELLDGLRMQHAGWTKT